MNHLAFVDTETTGLDADRHDMWELAVIVRGHRDPECDGEWLWQLRPDLSRADPTGLRIGRYYERRSGLLDIGPPYDAAVRLAAPAKHRRTAGEPFGQVAYRVARLLDGAHMVGAVPDFDAAFLARFLRAHGQSYTAHYHLIDVETLTVGYLCGQGQPVPSLPWRSDDLAAAVGVSIREEDRHTALGDARWARDIYDAVTGRLP